MDVESRYRDESCKSGEGRDTEIGGTTNVISLIFIFDFWAAFSFGSEVDGAEDSDEAFFPATCFIALGLETFLAGSLIG